MHFNAGDSTFLRYSRLVETYMSNHKRKPEYVARSPGEPPCSPRICLIIDARQSPNFVSLQDVSILSASTLTMRATLYCQWLSDRLPPNPLCPCHKGSPAVDYMVICLRPVTLHQQDMPLVQDTIVAIGHSDDDLVHVSNVQEGFQESSFSSDFTQVSFSPPPVNTCAIVHGLDAAARLSQVL